VSLREHGRRARLLAVDDVRETLRIFERAAARCRVVQFDVALVQDPWEALKRATGEDFDVVIVDYRMPRVDGLDVLAAARARNPEGLRLLTTSLHEASFPARRMEAARPHRCLEKPIERGELAVILERLILERVARQAVPAPEVVSSAGSTSGA
jgi:CheY-like chemotaxis protein